MTTPFQDRLEDLVREVPAHVVRADLAATARRAGVRRQRRRRIALTATTVVAIAVVGGVATALPRVLPVAPAGIGADEQGAGYPGRVEYAYRTHELPAKPGPLAGLVSHDAGRRDAAGSAVSVWYGVTADGRQWRLPGAQRSWAAASLSPDGRKLAFFPERDGPLVIRDLVAGGDVTVDRLVAVDDHKPAALMLMADSVPIWSGDDATLAIQASLNDEASPGVALVDAEDGSVDFTPELGTVIGVGADGVAWTLSQSIRGPIVRAVTIGPAGSDRGTRLDLDYPIAPIDPSSARLSPDGRQVALVVEGEDGTAHIETFDAATGRRLTRSTGLGKAVDNCPVAFAGSTVALPARPSESLARLLVGESGRALVLADPRNRAGCSTWSAAALAGPVHRSVTTRIFGMYGGWLSWWWRELLLAGVLIGAVVGWLVRRRSRRTSRPRAAG